MVLLVTFALIESRSRHALMPLRILENRSRTGAYVVMLCLATAMFGIFFFLTIFVQEVLGYSALRSGVAFLPFAGTVVLMSGVVSQLISRVGARPFMVAGASITAVGMYWFSHLTVHSQYVSGLLGPMLVTSVGLGMLFVPLSLVALNKVRGEDSGVASSLLNTGQQVGGAIGLAALGTVTWTVVSNSVKHQVAQAAAAAGGRAGLHLPAGKAGGTVPAPILHQALAVGISRGFLVAAGIAVLALIVVLVTIRLRREDLAGASPMPAVADTRRGTRSREFPGVTGDRATQSPGAQPPTASRGFGVTGSPATAGRSGSPTVVGVRDVPWWGVISSAATPVLLIGGWTVAAGLQPQPFDSIRQSVSTLAGPGVSRPLGHEPCLLGRRGLLHHHRAGAAARGHGRAARPDRCRSCGGACGDKPASCSWRLLTGARFLVGAGIRVPGRLAGGSPPLACSCRGACDQRSRSAQAR